MQSFRAILYGADVPLAGVNVEVRFNSGFLTIKNPSISIYADKITMTVGGFEHNEFYLHWLGDAEQPMSLKLVGKEDIAWLTKNAPAPLNLQFNQWHKRQRSIKAVWGSLLSAALACVLSLGMIWWHYDDVLGWLAHRVSLSQEEALGKSILSQLESEGDLIKQGLAVETVQTIGKQLTANTHYHYQWLIKNDKTVNAFALPGGIIVVHSALIAKAETPDELAAVLAHEVQHVERQHALKNMINSFGWAVTLVLVLGDVNTATAVIVHQLGNMVFSRDVEDEADRLGLQALINAKIKPEGMASMLKKLAKEPGVDLPEWLSSHPDIQQRIKTIETLLAEKTCSECKPLVFDWKKIQQDKLLQKPVS